MTHYKAYIIAAIAFVGSMISVGAQTVDPIDDAVAKILASNLDLQIRAQQHGIDIESLRNDNVLEGPEVEGEYKFAPSGVENRWGIGISQGFDWPGLYASRRRHAEHMDNAYRLMLRADAAEVALQARTLLIGYVRACAKVHLLTQAKENVSQLDTFIRRAYESESATILMVQKTRHLLFETNSRLLDAMADSTRISAGLRAMGDDNLNLSAVKSFPLQPLLPVEQYQRMADNDNIDLSARNSLIEAEKSAINVARNANMPHISIGYNHDFEDGTHFNGFRIGIGLPKWNRSHATKSARASLLAAQLEKENYMQGIYADIVADWHRADDIERRLAPVADEMSDTRYIELLSRAFEGGQMTVFDYLRELNDYIEYRMNVIDMQHDYATALARLNRFTFR